MDSIRTNLHLAPNVYDTLVALCKKKGLSKSAVVTVALEKLEREEEDREKGK